MNLIDLKEQDIESVINDLFSSASQFHSVEEAYQKLTELMCKKFHDNQDISELVLSRVYHSFDFQALPASLQQVVTQVWGEKISENSKLITLMGTYGDKPEWCDRAQSKGHRAILLNQQTVNQIPMVTRLLQQIGFDLGLLMGVEPEGITLEGIQGSFGIFYVSPALGSPYIPAQDFVVDNRVECVIGTGVNLPSGDISIYIGFCRVNIEQEVAANLASLMSLFWQHAYPLMEKYGVFS